MKLFLTINPPIRVNLFACDENQSHHLFDIDPMGLFRYRLQDNIAMPLDEENKLLVEGKTICEN